MDFTVSGVALDVEDCRVELAVYGINGFESVVFEDFLADFIPEILLWIEFWRVGRQEQQRNVVWNREIAAAMVWSSIEDQQDVLPGKSSRQDVKEALEACRVRCRHDQIDAGPVLRRDGTIQIDVFANELAGHLRPDAAWRPARPPPALGGRRPRPPDSAWKAVFLKSC